MAFAVFIFVLLFIVADLIAWATQSLWAPDGLALRMRYFPDRNQPWYPAFLQEFKPTLDGARFVFAPYVMWQQAPTTGTYVNINADGTRATANPPTPCARRARSGCPPPRRVPS